MKFENGIKTKSGYLALPPSDHGPGVIVLHAWWGLNEFFTALCDRLALEGFVSIAPDLFDGETASSIEDAEKLRNKHEANPSSVEAKVLDSLEILRQLPAVYDDKVGTIGFSLGAYWAMHVASIRPDDIAAVVVFYGYGDPDFSVSNAAYLGHFGEKDTWEPLEYVHDVESQIRAAGKDVTFYVYPGAGHWFVEDNRPDVYDEKSAQLAWTRTLDFLNEKLQAPSHD